MKRVKDRIKRIVQDTGRERVIVSYSGGKDSTALLDICLEVVKEEGLKLLIVHSDTLVENPIVHEHAFLTLKKVKDYCSSEGIGCEVKIARPEVKYTYWVNTIGKGYPLPHHKFRWCQDKLKIKPVKKLMAELDGVMFVATRISESPDRKRSMSSRLKENFEIERNGVAVFAPMYDVSEEEIWEFLSTRKPPYDTSYERVIEIYKEARGECPLIPDNGKAVSGCGMRFGCWVCTLVREDRTLKNQIKNHPALKELYDFRKFLIGFYEDIQNRSPYRRNGKPAKNGKGVLKVSARKALLNELLKLQERIGQQIISDEELLEVEKIWEKDLNRFGSNA